MGTEPASRRWLPAALALGLRAWGALWRVRVENADVLADALSRGPVIFAFWHGEQLALIRTHADRGIVGLVSQSRDGDWIAPVMARLGYGVVRGSSSRGGKDAWHALRDALAAGRCLGITVDGPRGPRHIPKPGALSLAAASGAPILAVVAESRPALKLRSWDRFEIPLPWARVTIRYGRMPAVEDSPEGLAAGARALIEAMAALSASGTTGPGPGTAPPR